ncbi:capsule biosynthesis protein [Escherichia phage dhabil]|uniref:Capsule biosynthesis protein n=1 Tax=Escherichia phage fDHCT2 TaxID=3075956 RepID=A0AB38Z2Z7_9CAUD|nr:capsule biosynthesis protein [Escherichia phage dhaeg]QHR72449.1 capsule biosynthesis protein [Escherichia phage dhabil]
MSHRVENKPHLCFDIDNTITIWNHDRDYENFKPDTEMVSMINKLYDEGYEITLFTARGMTSCGPGRILVEVVPALVKNLEKIGLKYHNLLTHKPSYTFIIDDRAIRPDHFKELVREGTLDSYKAYHP